MLMTKVREWVGNEIEYQRAHSSIVPANLPGEPIVIPPEAPDDEPVIFPYIDFTITPHIFVTNSLEKLSALQDEITAQTGIHLPYKDYVLRHEYEHSQAALHAGQTTLRYMAYIQTGRDTETTILSRISVFYAFVIEGLTTTKLGAGSIFAAPTIPSALDEAALKAFGYSGSDDVIKRAAQYNDQHGAETYYINPWVLDAMKS